MRKETLAPAFGSRTSRRRIGRGIGSGMGKTSTKGHKGQWARSGGGVRVGFEGGQMPLIRRMPKTGFDNAFKKVYSTINICELNCFEDGATIDLQMLLDCGLIRKANPYGVKILGNGELTKKLTIRANKFTNSAKEKIVALGGAAEEI